jgi:hypothetical protein
MQLGTITGQDYSKLIPMALIVLGVVLATVSLGLGDLLIKFLAG